MTTHSSQICNVHKRRRLTNGKAPGQSEIASFTTLRRQTHMQNIALESDLAEGVSEHHLRQVVECQYCQARLWPEEGSTSCCSSKRAIPLMKLRPPPPLLLSLLDGSHPRSSVFRERIRLYNSSLAFAAFCCRFDTGLIGTRGPYVFRIHGATYSTISDVGPGVQEPKFGQIWILPPEHQLRLRDGRFGDLDDDLQASLQMMLQSVNIYCSVYMAMGRILEEGNGQNVTLVMPGHDNEGTRQLAALLPGDGFASLAPRTIYVRSVDSPRTKQLDTLHQSYDPLIYVLLFPHGTTGWFPEIARHDSVTGTITCLMYYK